MKKKEKEVQIVLKKTINFEKAKEREREKQTKTISRQSNESIINEIRAFLSNELAEQLLLIRSLSLSLTFVLSHFLSLAV